MQIDSRIRRDSVRFDCPHIGLVQIDTKVVYPRGFLDFSPPRIQRRDCDHYTDCRLMDKYACPMAVNRI